jgi:hypothetical protein
VTQLRHCKCDNSNHFDHVYDSIGHRGSSFSDIDGVSHDGKTQRFLLQEFKREGERRDPAQHWMLSELTRTLQKLPQHFTVWIVERRTDGMYGWAEYGQPMQVITREELRARFRAWWDAVPFVSTRVSAPCQPNDPIAERTCDACGGAIYSGEEWFNAGSSDVQCSDCHYTVSAEG